MSTFTTGDTAPALTGTVNTNLTGAALILHLRKPSGVILTLPAQVADPAAGAFSYQWRPDDLDAVGAWKVEAQVTYSDGRVQTFGPSTFYVQGQIA